MPNPGHGWVCQALQPPDPVGPNFQPLQSEGAGRGLVSPFWGQQTTQRMHDQSSGDMCDYSGHQQRNQSGRKLCRSTRGCTETSSFPHEATRREVCRRKDKKMMSGLEVQGGGSDISAGRGQISTDPRATSLLHA